MDTKPLSALIDSFYTASTQPEKWPEAAAQVASFFDSESAAIQVRMGGFSNIALRATTANYDPAAQQEYVAYFHKLDPFINGWRAIGTPGIFLGRELVDPETFRKSEIYNDYCHRLGIFHTLGAGEKLGSNTKLILGIHRSIEQEDFDEAHKQRLEVLLPHLSRAIDLHIRLTAADLERRLASRMFETLSVAAIIVDKQCRLMFANNLADQLLKVADGLRVQQARLTTCDARQDAALRQAVCQATAVASGEVSPPSDVLAVRRAHKRPLSVLIAPFQGEAGRWTDGPAEPTAIVFASDPKKRRPPSITALAALYGLTPAEARLLQALLQGEQVGGYAVRAGITTNTANTQLKRIFAKTETGRQADLMRLVFSDPIASLAAEE
jgi:DNA-binding CsgD family transcriptional regulator